MKLVTSCTDCKNQIKIPAFMISDRIELARKQGKEFEVRCMNCGQRKVTHVDDVKATKDLTIPLISIVSILLAVFLTIWFWNWGFISTASFIIPLLLISTTSKNERTKISLFNQMYYDSGRLIKK